MNRDAKLTKRESEVAELLAWGAAKKQIAQKLGISIRTVENTARSIYVKVNVFSVGALCAWWFCKTYNITAIGPLGTFLAVIAQQIMQ